MLRHFDHVTVAVTDIPGAVRFFGLLGFELDKDVVISGPTMARYMGIDNLEARHVTLCLKDGTTQIDHILVSRFGVFIIETKDYKGWLFANASQGTWTQVLFKYRFTFQNPIFQNARHVRAVRTRCSRGESSEKSS